MVTINVAQKMQAWRGVLQQEVSRQWSSDQAGSITMPTNQQAQNVVRIDSSQLEKISQVRPFIATALLTMLVWSLRVKLYEVARNTHPNLQETSWTECKQQVLEQINRMVQHPISKKVVAQGQQIKEGLTALVVLIRNHGIKNPPQEPRHNVS